MDIMPPDARRARITKINEEIARLVAERHALTESLTFPVVTLPVEITSQIFLHCLPDNPLDPTAFNPSVVLGLVCRQWRDVALSLPQLWSAWSLAVDGVVSDNLILHSLELWQSRSQNRSLTIRLYHQDGAGQDVTSADEHWWQLAGDSAKLILPTILPHHQRWEHVELNLPLTFLRTLADATPSEGLPCLTHLLLGSTQADWGGDDASENRPITFFANAPRLRSLHLVLEAQCQLPRLDHVHLPYAQLTSFTGTSFSAAECLTVLAEMTSLLDCVFHLGPRVRFHNLGSPILSPLKSLKLYTNGPHARAVIVLENLKLPSLDTLLIGHEELVVPNVLQALSDRSGHTLLHFSCHTLGSEELVECLQTMPLLTTLELLDYDQAGLSDVIRHLDYKLGDSDPQQLIPNLHSLTIECHRRERGQVEEFSYHAVLSMLRMMVGRVPTPLRRFRMVWTSSLLPRPPNEWETDGFRRLAEKGMDIYVGSPERSWL
ncbi:hypothetical protein B0H16DRAFT_970024 [Mycena metata]|uniref:F-box domain-containing protein n=1 Tax=Mycena metata TaxID=1033252 RepID=A0AAD7N447_9AGAR|nr:hypothetical protein B0H16DRAFT_970024 [Mycena metata]